MVKDSRAGPAEQCRNDEAGTLARTGRREGHDVLRAVMAQIVVSEPAEKDPGITMKAGALDLAGRCPSRGTICGDVACLPRPPQRTGDRCATPEKSACARDGDRKSTRLNSRPYCASRMPSSS